MGLQARLMSQALRKLSGIISKSNTVAIFINQLREKVGVMFEIQRSLLEDVPLNSIPLYDWMSVGLKL